MNQSFNHHETWPTYTDGATLTFHSMHPTPYPPVLGAINTQSDLGRPHENPIFDKWIINWFSHDPEGNVFLLKLMIFILCKHAF